MDGEDSLPVLPFLDTDDLQLLVPILNARTIAGFVSGKVADRGAGDTQIHRRRQYADVARLGNAAMTAGTVVSR